MKIAGIIAEYNPFHNGHALQLRLARRAGAQAVVVCMSCNVVQRGQFALLPPAVRVQAALESGADVVLALPDPYAGKSAEGFAAAGVRLLTAFGCDTLVFGAEEPRGDFMQAAAVLLNREYAEKLRQNLEEGISYAAARQAAVRELSPAAAQLVGTPNNNLGVEYCKAILQQGLPLKPLPLRRVGSAHGQPGAQGCFSSAQSLRALWGQTGPEGLRTRVPEEALRLYEEAYRRGEDIDPLRAEIALLARLRGLSPEELAQVRGVSEGLENRLHRAIVETADLESLYSALKTKRYAHARVRRLTLDAALGYTDALPSLPPYLHVLGARRQALELCSRASLPCGTSLARLQKMNADCGAVARAHARSADLAALCRRRPDCGAGAYTQPPILL